jgi:hypothetical protein
MTLTSYRLVTNLPPRTGCAGIPSARYPRMPRKRRRSSDPVHDIVVVTTADGTRLRCSIATIGRGTEPRWMLLDAKGEQFVGPVATPDRSEEGVRRLVEDWWANRTRPASRAPEPEASRPAADAS